MALFLPESLPSNYKIARRARAPPCSVARPVPAHSTERKTQNPSVPCDTCVQILRTVPSSIPEPLPRPALDSANLRLNQHVLARSLAVPDTWRLHQPRRSRNRYPLTQFGKALPIDPLLQPENRPP